MTMHFRWFPLRLDGEPLDAFLSFWGCVLGGLGLSGLAAVTVWQTASSEAEILMGVTGSMLDCLLLFLLGIVSRQVHLAGWKGKAPWRARRQELLAHAVGIAVLAIGGWTVTNIPADEADALTTGLLFLAIYITILCLGCCFTLAESRRRSAERASDPLASLPNPNRIREMH